MILLTLLNPLSIEGGDRGPVTHGMHGIFLKSRRKQLRRKRKDDTANDDPLSPVNDQLFVKHVPLQPFLSKLLNTHLPFGPPVTIVYNWHCSTHYPVLPPSYSPVHPLHTHLEHTRRTYTSTHAWGVVLEVRAGSSCCGGDLVNCAYFTGREGGREGEGEGEEEGEGERERERGRGGEGGRGRERGRGRGRERETLATTTMHLLPKTLVIKIPV